MEERTITLVAKQPLTYAGREFQAGDVFSAAPIDAAVMTYRRKAKFADVGAKPTPNGLICPDAKGELGEPGPPDLDPEPEPRRRRYRTRQLKAEE